METIGKIPKPILCPKAAPGASRSLAGEMDGESLSPGTFVEDTFRALGRQGLRGRVQRELQLPSRSCSPPRGESIGFWLLGTESAKSLLRPRQYMDGAVARLVNSQGFQCHRNQRKMAEATLTVHATTWEYKDSCGLGFAFSCSEQLQSVDFFITVTSL